VAFFFLLFCIKKIKIWFEFKLFYLILKTVRFVTHPV